MPPRKTQTPATLPTSPAPKTPTKKRRRGGHVAKKPSTHIPIERLVEVERRVLMFQTPSKIASDLAMLWEVKPETIERYVRIVRGRLEEAHEIELPRRRAFMRAVGEHGMSKSYQLEDPKAAAVFYDRLCKLDGLFAPERVAHEHAGAIGVVVDVANPEAVRKRIEELQQRLAARPKALPAKTGTP